VRGTVAALAAPAIGVVYVAVAQFVFEHGTVLAQAGPLAALALSSVATVAVSSLLESVERQRIAEVNDLLEEQVRERASELRATELEIIKRLARRSSRVMRRPASTSSGSPTFLGLVASELASEMVQQAHL
jgi:hypothetical protein